MFRQTTGSNTAEPHRAFEDAAAMQDTLKAAAMHNYTFEDAKV